MKRKKKHFVFSAKMCKRGLRPSLNRITLLPQIAFVLAVAIIGLTVAAPVEVAKIVKFENESFDDGGYHF